MTARELYLEAAAQAMTGGHHEAAAYFLSLANGRAV